MALDHPAALKPTQWGGRDGFSPFGGDEIVWYDAID